MRAEPHALLPRPLQCQIECAQVQLAGSSLQVAGRPVAQQHWLMVVVAVPALALHVAQVVLVALVPEMAFEVLLLQEVVLLLVPLLQVVWAWLVPHVLLVLLLVWALLLLPLQLVLLLLALQVHVLLGSLPVTLAACSAQHAEELTRSGAWHCHLQAAPLPHAAAAESCSGWAAEARTAGCHHPLERSMLQHLLAAQTARRQAALARLMAALKALLVLLV